VTQFRLISYITVSHIAKIAALWYNISELSTVKVYLSTNCDIFVDKITFYHKNLRILIEILPQGAGDIHTGKLFRQKFLAFAGF